MWNVLLDPLPDEWNGYPIDSDFQTGIQISMCLSDSLLSDAEKQFTAADLLFPDEDNRPEYIEDAMEGVKWFLSEYDHDHHEGQQDKAVMDFDVDQWRIYAAFLCQYNIDLNTVKMHWFVFMGLLANLQGSAFTDVLDIRTKKIYPGMSKEEKESTLKAKRVYALHTEKVPSDEEKKQDDEAVAHFQQLIGKG